MHPCPAFHTDPFPGCGHAFSLPAAHCTHRLKTWRERPGGSSSLTLLDSVLEKQVQTLQGSQAPLQWFLSLLKIQETPQVRDQTEERWAERKHLQKCFLLAGPHFSGLKLAPSPNLLKISATFWGRQMGGVRLLSCFLHPSASASGTLALMWTSRLQASCL